MKIYHGDTKARRKKNFLPLISLMNADRPRVTGSSNYRISSSGFGFSYFAVLRILGFSSVFRFLTLLFSGPPCRSLSSRCQPKDGRFVS